MVHLWTFLAENLSFFVINCRLIRISFYDVINAKIVFEYFGMISVKTFILFVPSRRSLFKVDSGNYVIEKLAIVNPFIQNEFLQYLI